MRRLNFSGGKSLEEPANTNKRSANDNDASEGVVIERRKAGDWGPMKFKLLREGETVRLTYMNDDHSTGKVEGVVKEKGEEGGSKYIVVSFSETKEGQVSTKEITLNEGQIVTLLAQVKKTSYD